MSRGSHPHILCCKVFQRHSKYWSPVLVPFFVLSVSGKNPFSPTDTAGLVTIILSTLPSLKYFTAACTASNVLPVPAGPIPRLCLFLGLTVLICNVLDFCFLVLVVLFVVFLESLLCLNNLDLRDCVVSVLHPLRFLLIMEWSCRTQPFRAFALHSIYHLTFQLS